MNDQAKPKRPVVRLGILFFIIVAICISVPILGIIVAVAILAGAILKIIGVLPKSFGGIIAGIDLGKNKTIGTLVVADIFMAMFVLLMSIASIKMDEEKKAEAEVATEKQRIADKNTAKAREKEIAALEKNVSQVLSDLETIAASANKEIEQKQFDSAKTLLDSAVKILSDYRRLKLVDEKLQPIDTEISRLAAIANGKVNSQIFENQAAVLFKEAVGLRKQSKWIKCSETLAGAQAIWNKIDTQNYDVIRNANLGKQITKLSTAIEAKVLKARKDLKRQFRLGSFYYWIGTPEKKTCIRNIIVKECAGGNGIFVIVPYSIENEGKETATVVNVDFKLIDAQNREFNSSSRGSTALAMIGKGDLILSELHPGVQRKGYAVFEIPESATGLKLVVPEKGLLSTEKKVIEL